MLGIQPKRMPRNMRKVKVVGKTVEELGVKQSKPDVRKMLDDFYQSFLKSVHFLIFSGMQDAWNLDYEEYKIACKSLQDYQKAQTILFSTAIGLCFGGKKAIDEFNRA